MSSPTPSEKVIVEVDKLSGPALDRLVCQVTGEDYRAKTEWNSIGMESPPTNYSSSELLCMKLIVEYGIGLLHDSGSACRKAQWFATPDGQSTSTSYEGEQFDPCFMVNEEAGVYGPTPEIAVARCLVISKLGRRLVVSKELLED